MGRATTKAAGAKGPAISEPVDAVREAGRIGVLAEQGVEELNVAADGVAVAGKAGVGAEHETEMGPAFALPATSNDREVRDVVGEQRTFLLSAQGEQDVVFFGFPALFGGGEHVVARPAELLGDVRGVVVVQRQFHAMVACSRSQRARSSASTRAAHMVSVSISRANSA